MAEVRLTNHDRSAWHRLTAFLRILPFLIAVIHATDVFGFDHLIASFWHRLLAGGWCNSAMSEANVAAGSFFFWILWFRGLDSVKWLQRFRFVERTPRPFGIFLTESFGAARNIKEPSIKEQRLLRVWSSLPVYLVAIVIFHCFRTPKAVQPEAPTFARVVGELGFGIVAYDFIFYWIHLGMHCWPNGPHGHSVHHEVSVSDKKSHTKFLEAELVVNHSLFDGALQVGVNIIVQNLHLWGGPKHKLSRYLHNILVTYLLTEAHAGLDLPWATHRVFPEIFGGALRHEIHHHLHKCCFHQFFRYIDDFLGYGPPESAIDEKVK